MHIVHISDVNLWDQPLIRVWDKLMKHVRITVRLRMFPGYIRIPMICRYQLNSNPNTTVLISTDVEKEERRFLLCMRSPINI